MISRRPFARFSRGRVAVRGRPPTGAGDTDPPALDGATIASDGLSIALLYNELLDTGSVPAAGAYSLSGTSITVSSVGIGGSTVTLTLSSFIEAGASITVSYTAGGSPVQDLAGNDAADLSSQAVTNNSTAIATLEITRTTTSDTWTSPATPGDTLCECVGGGEGGQTATGGGGGGAHAHITFTYAVSTGYARVAGAGGAAGGTNGGNSTFNGTTCVAEGGGVAGAHAGGRASASTGTTKFDGGAGTTGAGGAAGGGSAGFAGAASGSTPGAPDGAWGRSTAGASAAPGAGGRSTASAQADGAAGRVRNTTAIPSDGVLPELPAYGTYRAAASTTHDISGAIPASVQVGDVVRFFFTTSGAPSVTFTDWTQKALQARVTVLSGAIYERVWTGTENTSITLGTSQSLQGYVVIERNAQSLTATAASGGSTSADPPDHTFSSGTYRVYAMASYTPVSGTTSASPAGYDGLGTLAPIGSGTTGMVLLWKLVTGTSENPGTYTLATTGDWVAITASSSR